MKYAHTCTPLIAPTAQPLRPRRIAMVAAPQIPSHQRGVVLIVALIVMIMMTLIAGSVIRTTSNSEQIANNARSEYLARQQAEAALRYCETAAFNWHWNQMVATAASQPTPPSYIPPAKSGPSHTITAEPASSSTAPIWQSLAAWDGTTTTTAATAVALVDLDAFGATGPATPATGVSFSQLYRRAPECMSQYATNLRNLMWVTARGFSPDEPTPAATTRPPPRHAEVFLQSTMQLPTVLPTTAPTPPASSSSI